MLGQAVLGQAVLWQAVLGQAVLVQARALLARVDPVDAACCQWQSWPHCPHPCHTDSP